MVDGDNPAVETASKLAFDEIEREMLIEAEAQAREEVVTVDEHWTPDMPSESKVNERGSTERFRRVAK